MRRSRKPSEKAQPKKAKVTREQLAAMKLALGNQLEEVYGKVMAFCVGRPPEKLCRADTRKHLIIKTW